jgi:hypothetical protein
MLADGDAPMSRTNLAQIARVAPAVCERRVKHNSRGVIQRYLGFWDCNPTTLIPLSPGDSAPLYVEMMGGARRILARGRELHDQGKYLLAQEIVNKLDHRFHESCHKWGIQFGFSDSYLCRVADKEQDGRSWQRGGGRLSCRLEMRMQRS